MCTGIGGAHRHPSPPLEHGPNTAPNSVDIRITISGWQILVTAARGVPDLSDSVHAAGCVVGPQPLQQTVAILTLSFGDHLHPTVVEIEGESGETPDLKAFALVNQRNPTCCTRPRTQAVSRTSSFMPER